MTADLYARSRALFDAASELPADQREDFVRAACADDAAVLANVLELLGYDSQYAGRATRQPLNEMLAEVARSAGEAPTRLGRYDVFEAVGQGGMGRVYRARRSDQIGGWLALKIVRQEFQSPALRARFAAERDILARLNHPNIAHFVDADDAEDGSIFVAMEWIDGLTLPKFIAANRPDLAARLGLFRQLLAAVAHAHRSLVIHRDIKPENVMVRNDGVLKLLDFGIAKLVAHEGANTQTRERMFTPMNAAPEQILGQPCDATTDVYALGALLYELLSGVPVFAPAEGTPGELEQAILKVPPAPMRRRAQAPGLPPEQISQDLENIVQKALRKEPDGRYRSVEQLDADIERLLANQPVSVSGNGFWYRTRKLIARHRLATALAVFTFLSLSSALVALTLQNREVVAERDRATAALDALRDAFLAADPDGISGGDISARQILAQSTHAIATGAKPGDPRWHGLLIALMEVQLSMGLLKDADATLKQIGSASETDPLACVLAARLLVEKDELNASTQLLERCPKAEGKAAHMAAWVPAIRDLKRRQYSEAAGRYADLAGTLTPEHPIWMSVQQQWAEALAGQGQLDTALNRLQSAESALVERFGPIHPGRGRIELARLQAMAVAGQDERLMKEGPAISERLRPKFGFESILFARAESLLGQTFLRHARLEVATPHLQNALHAFLATLGQQHEVTLRSELNLAVALAGANGNGEAAGPHFQRVAELAAVNAQPGFHAFAQLQAAKWLGLQGDSKSVRSALTLLADSSPGYANLDEEARNEWRQWTVYLFWEAACAVDQGRYDAAAVCDSQVATPPICAKAHQLVCGSTGPDARRSTP